MLDLSLIRIDGGTQIRAELNQETVDAYAEAYAAGAVFPPVTVFFDGKDRWLADGFHRYFAAKKAGKTAILENITPGTKRDAILFSLGANGTHGLNRTNADKRNAVETMLQDPEWAAWSDNAIAKACLVDHKTVAARRIAILGISQDAPATRTVARNGKTYEQNTANIGRAVPAAPVAPAKPAPVVEPEAEAPPDYSELDAAREQISDLQADLVVARMGDIPDDDKQQAATLIAELQAEIKTLTATNRALILSRDSLMEEAVQMKRQMAMQRKEIDKLKTSK
jgi:hypothetical protein